MKSKVSLQVPASLSDFSAADDGRTIAKLKMFYVGETADGRVFTKEFADKLVESLPYCPVVGFYSDIQDDFLGHNSKQFIYGFVRPDATFGYETDEDGKEWLVTEVMLYTDRPDNTGEVARKIVGKPHSLELNPNNVKYEMFTENGRHKIKFTDGSLIGLSVLGDNQKPAFTGSEFFMATDFSDMKERFESFFSFLEENSRGEQMVDDKEKFESYVDFVKLSYNDKMRKAEQELSNQLGDNFACYIEDMDDTSFIAGKFSYETGEVSYCKYDYSLSEAEFLISNERAAFRKFLTVEEMNYLEGYTTMADNSKEDKKPEDDEEGLEDIEDDDEKEVTEHTEQPEETVTEETVETTCAASEEGDEGEENTSTPVVNASASTEEGNSSNCEAEDAVVNAKASEEKEEDKEDDKEDDKEEEKDESKEDEEKEFSEHTSALCESERKELESFRRKAKEELIGSYNGMLSKETLDTFMNKVDEFEYSDLEAKLAIEFVKYSKDNKSSSKEIPLSFGKMSARTNEDDSYAGLVSRILNR